MECASLIRQPLPLPLLSNRYISDRFLPDKAIDLIDEAASKLRIEIDSMPTEIDEVERKKIKLEIEREALKKEKTRHPKSILPSWKVNWLISMNH